jgi:hypothetical protein
MVLVLSVAVPQLSRPLLILICVALVQDLTCETAVGRGAHVRVVTRPAYGETKRVGPNVWPGMRWAHTALVGDKDWSVVVGT